MQLTKKNFRAWLASKNPDSIAGVAGASDWCPIARYLRDNGCTSPVIDQCGLSYYKNGRYVESAHASGSSWKHKFIDKVDKSRGRVTAKKALKILDSI